MVTNTCIFFLILLKNTKGETLLHTAAKPEVIQLLLDFLPDKDKYQALQVKDNTGKSALHNAVENPMLLKAILEKLSELDWIFAIHSRDDEGKTVFEYVMERNHPELFHYITNHSYQQSYLETIKQPTPHIKNSEYSEVKQLLLNDMKVL